MSKSDLFRDDLTKVMSDWDINNLYFLLNADDEQMKKWYKECTEDDLLYANDLMDRYSTIINVKAMELMEEFECDLTLSKEVLSKFMINGSKDG